MDYVKQLEAFYSTLDYNPISTNAIALYLYIMHTAFRLKWTAEFTIANTTLISKLKMTIKELQSARNELITRKYLKYKKGSNQNKAPRYSVPRLYSEEEDKVGQAQGQAEGYTEGKAERQTEVQPQGYIITILYLLFNYINKGENSNFFKDISESQRGGIRNILKKVDVIVENSQIFEMFDEQRQLEILVQYYVVKELYFSAYKVILEKLTKEEFMLKFLKAEQYVQLDKENISLFINYFKKCLKEKVDKGFERRTNEER